MANRILDMRIVRLMKGDEECFGVLQNGYVQALSCEPFNFPVGTGALLSRLSGDRWPLEEVDLRPPCSPTKYVGVGLNYSGMFSALNLPMPKEPFLFLKPSTAVIGHGQKILLPEKISRIACEGELAVVIGKECRNVQEKDAGNYIFGYTATNDVTDMTALELDGRNLVSAKGRDTFAAIGPWIETDIDPAELRIETFVNGRCFQSGNTRDLIFGISQCVSMISNRMTLLPGDVIALGTPSIPPEVGAGDTVEIRIDGIGVLINEVENIS